MASRAVGALLGVSAAAVIAVSLATPAWWDGHPRVDGHTISAKTVSLGLWGGATGCNTGGDEKCSPVPLNEMFAVAALGELGLAGLAALVALALGISAARDGKRKKGVAKLAIASALVAAAGGGVLFLLGPGIISEKSVGVPIGWGMMLFWGGVASAALGAIATIVSRPEPLRLKTAPPPQLAQVAYQPAPLDVHESLRDQLVAPTMSSALADMRIDSDALGNAPTPLITTRPQLRAMYDPDGAGVVPAPIKPQLPTRPPTPMPRAQINALVGLPTPPGVAAVEPKTVQSLPPPPASNLRAESEPIDPPPPSAPPPAPPPPPPMSSAAPRSPFGRTTPPPPNRAKPATAAPCPRPSIQIHARGSAPSISPEKRSKPTISHAIPPPPVAEPRARPETEQDGRLEVGMRTTEPITSVEAEAVRPDTAQVEAAAEAVGDSTDVGVAIEPPSMATSPTDTPASPPPVVTPPPIIAAPAPPAPAPAPAPPPAPAPAPAERASPVPISTAPTSLPPPKTAQFTTSGPTPACPQCESPMAWVEEHLRFYCKQCRMYF